MVFEFRPELFKAVRPEISHERADRIETIGVHRVQVPPTVCLHVYEACVLEDLEVVRDRLLAGSTSVRYSSDGQWLIAHQPEDLLPLGSSERCEHIFCWHPASMPPPLAIHK